MDEGSLSMMSFVADSSCLFLFQGLYEEAAAAERCEGDAEELCRVP